VFRVAERDLLCRPHRERRVRVPRLMRPAA
jgi:hypothetical protein